MTGSFPAADHPSCLAFARSDILTNTHLGVTPFWDRTPGQTPHRYLTKLRIAKACELLHDPYQSIVDISLAVGFSSQSHLTTVFRRFVKTTPAAYREAVLGIRDPEPCARTTQTS